MFMSLLSELNSKCGEKYEEERIKEGVLFREFWERIQMRGWQEVKKERKFSFVTKIVEFAFKCGWKEREVENKKSRKERKRDKKKVKKKRTERKRGILIKNEKYVVIILFLEKLISYLLILQKSLLIVVLWRARISYATLCTTLYIIF